MPENRILTAAGSIASLVIIAVLLPAIASATDSGLVSVKYLDGTARKKSPGSEGWLTIDSSSTISIDDSVKTLEDGRLEIGIFDGSTNRIGANTLVLIIKGDIPQSGGEITVELIYGELWTFIDSDSELFGGILMPGAIIGGENFTARFSAGDDGTGEIKLYDGELIVSRRLTVTNDSTDTEKSDETEAKEEIESEIWTEVLKPGEKIITSSRGNVIYCGSFSPDDPDEDTDWVRWNKDRDVGN